MSILTSSLESTLPGVLVDIENDYAKEYDTSLWNTTKSCVIIGTAFDGPQGEVTPIFSIEHAKYYWGNIFDEDKNEEASLVAGIIDAYNTGCRTIYGYRIGGVSIYKDFDLCTDSKLKLRVSGLFPSNNYKDCYFVFNRKNNLETLTFYKPVEKATIKERKSGIVVSDMPIIANTIKLNESNGIDRNSRLTELIDAFNSYNYNNVLKLSLVDEDGNDQTKSLEAYKIKVGALYEGAYFIGRNKTNCTSYTQTSYNLCLEDGDSKPYSDYSGKYYKTLSFNTDINSSLPIFATSYFSDLAPVLKEVGIVSTEEWDFLETANAVDKLFEKDDVDYAETQLSNFEIYKRLGGDGYAITAMAQQRINSKGEELTPKIVETPSENDNYIATISNGEYNVLQDADVYFRVLACVGADEKIKDSLPKAADFLTTVPKAKIMFGDLIEATSVIKDEEDAKAYSFTFKKIDEMPSVSGEEICLTKVASVIAKIDSVDKLKNKNIATGTQFLLANTDDTNQLIRVGENNTISVMNGKKMVGTIIAVENKLYAAELKEADSSEEIVFKAITNEYEENGNKIFENKKYVLIDSCDVVFVAKLSADGSIEPLAELSVALENNQENTLIYAENKHFDTNNIIVQSAIFDVLTIEEIVQAMNENEILENLFTFDMTTEGELKESDYIVDVVEESEFGKEFVLEKNKETSYDYTKYIPYRTTDNFARQFAQHCAYTQLLTGATHGIIGTKRFTDFSLTAVKKRIDDLLEFLKNDIDLYAKNKKGKYFLNKENEKFAIGRNLSLTFFENPVTDNTEGYEYVGNGAAAYAGMMSKMPDTQSTTAQEIDVSKVYFVPTLSQLNALNAYGVVTVRDSFTKGLIISDGTTMAPADSLMRRWFVVRTINLVDQYIRKAAEPFIGRANSQANNNTLKTNIKSALDSLVGEVITQYDFAVLNEDTYTGDAYIDINYNIYPINEIRNVNNYIRVSKSGTSN